MFDKTRLMSDLSGKCQFSCDGQHGNNAVRGRFGEI